MPKIPKSKPWLLLMSAPMLIGTLTAAKNRAPSSAPHGEAYVMTGQCTYLSIRGSDVSGKCENLLESHTLTNGRVGFTFVGGDVATIVFSGLGAHQVTLSSRSASQPVDRVTFTLLGMGLAPNILKATGECSYSDPFSGRATIRCTAKTSVGEFGAEFETDGREPSAKRF